MIKKPLFFLFVVFLLTTQTGLAQTGTAAEERIKAYKIGLITQRLQLTPSQSQQFWPLYNDYNQKKVALRQSLRQLKMAASPKVATDEEIRADLQEALNLRQREVDTERKYQAHFLKVLSPRQVAQLYQAEQQFAHDLIKRLEDRKARK